MTASIKLSTATVTAHVRREPENPVQSRPVLELPEQLEAHQAQQPGPSGAGPGWGDVPEDLSLARCLTDRKGERPCNPTPFLARTASRPPLRWRAGRRGHRRRRGPGPDGPGLPDLTRHGAAADRRRGPPLALA